MRESKLPWDWPVFFKGFWIGFGRMMAAFCIIFLAAPLVMDTSFADFESAQVGLWFAVIVSTICGIGNGEGEVREWRYQQSEKENIANERTP